MRTEPAVIMRKRYVCCKATRQIPMIDMKLVSPDDIRAAFSAAMSAMYRDEVPAYGTLMELVAKVNAETLAADPALQGAPRGDRFAGTYLRGTPRRDPSRHAAGTCR